MDHSPQRGDVLLRGDVSAGFELLDAMTHSLVQGEIPNVSAAIEAARACGAKTIWQQSFDNRGRPMGDPFRLLQPPNGEAETQAASDEISLMPTRHEVALARRIHALCEVTRNKTAQTRAVAHEHRRPPRAASTTAPKPHSRSKQRHP